MSPSVPRRRARPLALLLALPFLAACDRDLLTAPLGPRLDVPTGGVRADIIAPPGFIRIGIVPETEEVSIGATGDYHVLDDATGEVLLSGSADESTVRLVSVAEPHTFWRIQVQCTSSQAFAEDWVMRVEQAGYEPYTEFVPGAGCWRLRVGRFATRQLALDEQPELFRLGLAPAPSGGGPSQATVFEGVTLYEASRGGTTVQARNPLRVVPQGGTLTIEGDPFRGVGEVRVNSDGTLAAINEVSIEDYLLGVVPRELGPIQFPFLEALKAQAVAARTYAIRNLGKRRSDGYDLVATVLDQVYGGMSAEHPLSSQAVQETAGVIATHGGTPIEALYSSTSGGYTANSEDVFTAVVPYLRGVPDHERGVALDRAPTLEVFRNHANAHALRAAAEGDFDSDWGSRHRWYVSWTPAEMRQVLSLWFGTDVGDVQELNVLERSSSGRALLLEVVGTNGTFTEDKDGIRSALKFVTSTGGMVSLHSTLVFIQPILDRPTKAVTGWEAWGGGFGHGVGMSQTGAVGMAEKGYTYDEILRHYYRGVTLEVR